MGHLGLKKQRTPGSEVVSTSGFKCICCGDCHDKQAFVSQAKDDVGIADKLKWQVLILGRCLSAPDINSRASAHQD